VAEERLQKLLARAGVASRRAAEALITAGRVRVDGRLVKELGTRVPARAKIEVDGRVVVAEPLVYVVLHKPRGVVCTLRDPEGRPTVAEYLKDVGVRVVPVGRLDFHTSGALICTNDGELASKLMHPRHHAQKEYVAKVSGVVDERTLERLRERIEIDGRQTQPAEVRLLRVEEGKSWLSVKLGEGRNRQVRRLGEHAGVPIMRLARVAHAGITAEDLRPGEWRRLNNDELRALKKEYGVPRRIHAADPLTDTARGGRIALRKPRTDGRRAREKEHAHDDGRRRDEPWGRGAQHATDQARPYEGAGARSATRGRDARPYGDVRRRDDARPPRDRDARPYGDARRRDDARPPRDRDARPYGDARRRDDARPPRDPDARPYGDARRRDDARPPRDRDARPYGDARRRDDARPPRDRELRTGERNARAPGAQRPRERDARPHGEQRPRERERPRPSGERREQAREPKRPGRR
jgi:23S rRNA pseudouridine2605 synthase